MANEKQQIATIGLVDFSGGINTSVAPQLLAENEYQKLKNLEFDFNMLKTRGGTSKPMATYPENIKSFFYNEATNTYIVCLANGDVYEEDLMELHNKVGVLTGNREPNYCRFDNKVFIASGDLLQYYDFQAHTLTTIENSKISDFVFQQYGRLAVTTKGDDNFYCSAVGDPYETGWTENTNNPSAYQWTEIGYKDDGDILWVGLCSGDIIIFKDNGYIYKLSGWLDSWQVDAITTESDVQSASSICNLGGSIVFITSNGLQTVESVQTYGNFSANNEIGRKFNKSLSQDIFSPKSWNLVKKRQLIVQPNSKNGLGKLFCYQYDIGAGIELDFPFPIQDMQDTQDGVLLASGKSLYRWHSRYLTDNGLPIEQEIETREVSSTGRILSRRIDVGIKGTGEIKFEWADKNFRYIVGHKRRVINFFSVCRESSLKLKTSGNILIEFVKLFITQI